MTREGLEVLKRALDLLEEERRTKAHSATYIREKKREAVEMLIQKMECFKG